jgi:hypothetical protein
MYTRQLGAGFTKSKTAAKGTYNDISANINTEQVKVFQGMYWREPIAGGTGFAERLLSS